MKFLIPYDVPIPSHITQTRPETVEVWDLGKITLVVRWPRYHDGRPWKSCKGRYVTLVSSADDRPIGGYIGISAGDDGFHIGSPKENALLRQALKETFGDRIKEIK